MILKIVDNIIYIETTSVSHLSIQLPSIHFLIFDKGYYISRK